MRFTRWLPLLLVLMMALPAAGQGEVARNSATVELPDRITFAVEAGGALSEATLRYGTNARSCQPSQGVVPVEPEATRAEWMWEFRRAGALPLGTQVWWEWDLTLTDGRALTTARQTITVLDDRRDWQTLSGGTVSVFWVEGDADTGQRYLDIAQRSLETYQAELDLTYDQPLSVFIYPTFEDLQTALLYLADWTGGVAFSDYSSTVFGVPTDSDPTWAPAVMSHELLHIVTGAATFNCEGQSMPVWLNEGLSMYIETRMQGASTRFDDDELSRRVEQGTLPYLRELANEFSAYGEDANLAYSQSGSVVAYLVRTFGPEQVPPLLEEIRAGREIDQALTNVYGLTTDSLDEAWRESLTGADQAVPTLQPTALSAATAVATLPMWDPAETQGTATPGPTQPVPPTPGLAGPAPGTGFASSLSVVALIGVCILVAGGAVVVAVAIAWVLAGQRGNR
jgi:hypothetical protein